MIDEEKLLTVARILEKIGDYENANKLLIKYIKSEALYQGIDMLELFYGANVYTTDLTDFKRALMYVRVAAYARKLYLLISPLKASANETGGWCTNGTDLSANSRRVLLFLKDVCKSGAPDYNHPNLFYEMINIFEGSKEFSLKLSKRVARLAPLNIITDVVSNRIEVSGDGLI